MEREDLIRIQETELEIMDELQRICNKYNLKCPLIGGSCIGAIRHKGFIPWDDDIDVAMLREDYIKLKEVIKEELSEKYFFQDFDTEKNYGYLFSKIRKNNTAMVEEYATNVEMHHGIWIDIFIYDYISDNKFIRKMDFLFLSIYKYLLICKCNFKMPDNKKGILNIFYYITRFISFFFSVDFLKNRCDHIMTKHNKKKSNSIMSYGSINYDKANFHSSIFDNIIVSDFNNHKYTTFGEYDYYLKKMYGDYMKLPPVEQRISNHDLYVLSFDKEYKR